MEAAPAVGTRKGGRPALAPRALAYCAVFGAAALLLPPLFHVLRLGSLFMPMYIPLMALAFFAPPRPAALTAFLVPLLSAAASGMPPWYPPIALWMAVELAAMVSLVSWIRRIWPRGNEWTVLAPVLLFGRLLFGLQVYGWAWAAGLPAGFLAGFSFLGGWPGLLLILAVVPGAVRARRCRFAGEALVVEPRLIAENQQGE